MDPKNLSIVFGTLLFGEDEIPKGVDVITLTQGKVSIHASRSHLSPDMEYWMLGYGIGRPHYILEHPV